MKYLNYLLIIIGSLVAFYSETGTGKNEYMLIGGVALLMIGIYRISKTIPSNSKTIPSNNDKDDTEDISKNE